MLSKNAAYLLQKRYCKPGETPEGVFKRVAESLAQNDRKFEERLYNTMESGIFLPNSPCLFNAGTKDANLLACYILGIADDIHAIFNTISNMAFIFKSGGGVGINFSPLRECGARLSGGGLSSGVISFMKIFDHVVDTVKQGGVRRGALMGILDYNHADIVDFIRVKLKGDLQNFNLSIMVNDDFMKMTDSDKKIPLKSPTGNTTENVKAKDIFELACFTAWCNGDPAFLFFDRINKDNPFYPEMTITATNPCFTGDTIVAVADGRNGVSIEQLTKENKDVPVYCKDGITTKIKMMRNIRKTGEKKEILKVNLDDGSFVKCTPNHKFILTTLVFKEAKDLNPGDSLLRFDSYLSNGYRQIQNLRRSKRQYRMIYEFFKGEINPKLDRIHHQDFIKINDFPENLVKYSIKEHYKLHDISGENNPMYKLKARGLFEDFKKRNKGYHNSGENNPMFGRIQTQESKEKNKNSHLGRIPWNKGLTKETDFRIHNHKVVSVEFCGYEDVYNGTVDDVHNFAILTSYEDNKFLTSSGIYVKNCSEVALPDYSACCLGSINLSKFLWKNEFNFDRFEEVIKIAMRALTSMNKISTYPLPEIAEAMAKYNPVGLGVMGFADCLIKLSIKYDSKECLDFIDQLGDVYKRVTDEYNKEVFYFYKRIIAPTGSLSILADCSSGIEPVYDTTFERRLTVGVIEETRDLYKSEYVRTAYQVSPEWHIKVLSQWQKWVNGGVSKTVNLPRDASVDDIKNLYKLAWKSGCKGVSIYRDGCRGDSGQVMVSKTNKFSIGGGKCSDDSCTL